MRFTSRPDTSLCSPTPTLSTLPGAASGVLAPRRGCACCSRFFTPPKICWCLTRSPSPLTPSLPYSCKPRFHSREHQEGSMWYILAAVPRECCYATQPNNPMRHRTSNLKHEIHLLRDYIQQCYMLSRNWLVSRLRSRNLERHGFWQHICFVSYMQARTYWWTAVPPAFFAAGCCTNQRTRRRRDRRSIVAFVYLVFTVVVLQLLNRM